MQRYCKWRIIQSWFYLYIQPDNTLRKLETGNDFTSKNSADCLLCKVICGFSNWPFLNSQHYFFTRISSQQALSFKKIPQWSSLSRKSSIFSDECLTMRFRLSAKCVKAVGALLSTEPMTHSLTNAAPSC